MEAARVWARSQRRRNRAAIVALVLLVGLSSGVALTALAGSRRSDTAYERLLEASSAADARVQYSSSSDIDDVVLAHLRADPGVEVAVPVWFTVGFSEASDYDIGVVHSPDPAFLHDIDRLRLSTGRLPAPESTNEVASGLGVAPVHQLPSLALAVVVAAAIGVSMTAAAGPARHAATRSPAVALRAE